MIAGLSNFLDEKGMKSVNELRGRAIPAYTKWGDLDINHKLAARVDPARCIGCNLCSHACPVPECITMVDDTRGKPFES
jgi:dihydropyrimidine dehydrogenase (NAD+) subunit PreA